jgi:hypothetical protein
MLNRGHPLAAGLSAFWVMHEGGHAPFECVLGKYGAVGGAGTTPAQSHTPYGLATFMDTSAIWYDFGVNATYQVSPPFSMFALVMFPSFGSAPGIINTCSDTAQQKGANLFVQGQLKFRWIDGAGAGLSSDYRQKAGTTSLTAGVWYALGASVRAATDMSLYVNGIDDGGTYTGSGGAVGYDTTNGCTLGALFKTSSLGTGGTIVVAGIWSRSLTDGEHEQLAANPFQMFTMPPLPVSEPPAAGNISAPFIAAGSAVYAPTLAGSTVGTFDDQSVSVSLG